MVKESVERRLAAILIVDVVGYSRLMGVDETGTLHELKKHRAELFAPKTAQYHGRSIKLMGDGELLEFPSVVEAVRFAVECQTAMTIRNADVNPQMAITFRIGINIGDIIVDGDDLYGDGVNIAARLEASATPGGICLSRAAHDQIQDRIDIDFDDLGEIRVKNIARPIHAFCVIMNDKVHAISTPMMAGPVSLIFQPRWMLAAISTLALLLFAGLAWMQPWNGPETVNRIAQKTPATPSIAVLPFKNISGDPEQEYFADGMTEDLISDLSKIPGLFVISRNSSFAFKKRSHDTREIGRKLGVRHLLEGSVRKSGDRVRITAQLVDTQTSGLVWTERYEFDFKDIFALQDKINRKIVSALKVRVTATGQKVANARPTRNPEAYDLFLRGRAQYYGYTPQNFEQAKKYFEKAIEIDPKYAPAYGFLSYVHTTNYLFTWPGSDPNLSEAIALAEKSVALDKSSSVAHARLGWIQGYLGLFDAAGKNFEKAVSLNPRDADALAAFGETMNRAGKPEKALPLIEKAIGIEPILPPSWDFAKGHSYLLMRRFEDALASFDRAIERAPKFLPARVQRARTYSELNRMAEAKKEIGNIQKIAPKYNLENARRMFPYPDAENRNRLINGLRQAGLPE